MEDPVYYVRPSELAGRSVFGLDKFMSRSAGNDQRIINVPRKFANGRFVSLFNKAAREIVCPHFWEFKPFIGCPYRCSYCYLQGTFRGNKSPRRKKGGMSEAVKELKDFIDWATRNGFRVLLNTGELADSMAVPQWTNEILTNIVPILKKHHDEYGIRHMLLFLTKAGINQIHPLLKNVDLYREYVIVSFSINAYPVAARYEEGAAHPKDRIAAAKKLSEAGFTVRIRIDPMMPTSGWILYYAELVDDLLSNLNPERITLGTLRGLMKTIRYSRDRDWLRFLDRKNKTSWGYKIEEKLRTQMYKYLIRRLHESGYTGPIALCKETKDVWDKLREEGMLDDPGTPGIWENVKCNCKL